MASGIQDPKLLDRSEGIMNWDYSFNSAKDHAEM
jgi:hypothetical protein